MAGVRSLGGREAGILAGIIQGLSRLALGRSLNPIRVQAHAPRGMLASFLSNMILGSGRWTVGRVPDEFFARLQRLFSEREIVELTAQIAQENYNAKSNRPLRVDANNFCALPLPKPRG